MGVAFASVFPDVPPRLVPRLAVLLVWLIGHPAILQSALEAWRRAEERFIEWVEAHPNPKARWLRKADALKTLHLYEG